MLTLLRRLRATEGFALPMALGTLVVSSLTLVTLVEYSSSNARNASYSKGKQSAFSLAEAGINNAMSVLSNPDNNALNPALLPETTDTFETGEVTWSGTLDQLNALWTLTATGKVANATGAAEETTRTLSAKVPVTPVTTQPLNNPSWNYIFSHQVTGNACDMTLGNTVQVGARLYVSGNLCMQNQAWISGGPVLVGGELTMYQTDNKVGTSTAPISELHVGTGCKWKNNARHDPCQYGAGSSGYDNVWATTITSEPPELSPPVADWDIHYLNSSPGPHIPCHSQSGTPPTWDNDANTSVPDITKRNNSVATTFNLTPSSSYSCWTAAGELAWDATTKTLTVRGTMFVDGNLKIENGSANLYNGQGVIYLSGTVLIKNSKMCGSVVSDNCDFATWDPNSEMLVFVANGSGGQTDVPTGVGIEIKSAQFQGGLYATNKIQFDTSSRGDGPLVASEVVLGQSIVMDSFPEITTVPSGMPSNPAVYAQPNPPQMFSG